MSADRFSSLALSLREAALRAGADHAEAFVRESESAHVETEQGKAEGVRRNRETAAALRVLKDGRLGFSYATGPGPGTAEELAASALAAARLVDPVEFDSFPAPAPGSASGISDSRVWPVPFARLLALSCELESAARAAERRIRKCHKPSCTARLRRTALAGGAGGAVSWEETLFSLMVEAVAEEGGESQTGYDSQVVRTLAELDPARVGGTAGRLAGALLGGKAPESGTFPVLLPPHAAVDFLSSLVPSFSAEEVQKGRSRLAGKAGEAMFSPLLTLRDDASLPGRCGTVPCDDEGVTPVPRDLVAAGVVNGLCHTLRTAARGKETPTGNGFRGSAASLPSPSPSNLVIAPGPVPLDPFAAGERVVRLEEVLGGHTIDPVTGDFSLGAAGFLLRRGGEPVPFRNGAVAGNLFDLFRALAGVGNDLEFHGSYAAPTLLAGGMTVTGS